MQEFSRNNYESEEAGISSFNAALNPELGKSFRSDFKYPDDTEDESEEQMEETVMPAEFYQNFDTFLSKCPPKLKNEQSLSSNEKSSQRSSSKVSVKSTTEKKKKPAVSVSDKTVFSVTAPMCGKGIDDDLLREAFAYTSKNDGQDIGKEEVKRSGGGKLARGGSSQFSTDREGKIIEDTGQRSRDRDSQGSVDRSNWRSQSEPFSSSHIDPPSKGSTSGSDGTGSGPRRQGGVVQKLRNKTLSNSSDSASSDFQKRGDATIDVSRGQSLSGSKNGSKDGDGAAFAVSSVSCEEDRNSRKNKKADMHSLVTNFEKGLTLKRLQMELSESKESLDKSREAIQSISDSFKRDIG